MHDKPYRRLKSILAALAALYAGAADADDWYLTCEQFKDLPVPAADQPSPQDRRALQGCSSEALYYGIEQAAAPENARKCAYLEREQGDDKVFGGSAMLMTIYANGRGAERNYELAIKFACALENGAAPAEMEGRIDNLITKKEAHWNGDDFSLCDDITSGYMMGMCEAHWDQLKAQERQEKAQALMAGWSTAERKAFEEKVRKAADAFFELRTDNEVDQSGTGRVAFYIAERRSLEEKLLKMLELLEQERFFVFSARQFQQADNELNTVYKKIHRIKNFNDGYGTITQDGIRQTQRAWIVYRDARVDFATLKYKVTPESMKTHLTQERTEMLKDFLL